MSSGLGQSAAQRVCVIGAGVSGLAVAKVFAHAGHQVTVFERQCSPGGVWAPARIYPGLTTQTPGDQYAFSDFPMPAHYLDWPSAAQVMDYLRAYVDRFEIASLIRYRSTVINISRPRGATSAWSVTITNPAGRRATHLFDFIVVCNGTFNIPNYPCFAGVELFRAGGGVVLHSSEFTDPKLIQDKRIIVIGYGKSATDIACFAAGPARSVHLIFRRPIWPVPRFLGGRIHVRHVCTSRLWESLMPAPTFPERSHPANVLKNQLPAVCWRAMEILLSHQFDLDRCGLRPSHKFRDQVTSGFLVSPDELFTMIKDGRISPVNETVEHFTPRGVVLSDGRQLEADVVVLGTGYRQEIPFLESDIRSRVIDDQGRYRLYRYLLNPDVPDLGFVGYNSSLFTPITSELGARWLAAHLTGRLALPATDQMHRAIDSELKIGKAVRPLARRFTGVNVAPYTYRYLDTLRKDLNESSQPKGLRRVYNFVKPFTPADFA
ncbi:MAG TPA: NAD(P)-binding domain-containing protein [Pseudonocardiaceae bacterium]|nr:NAD(P)-binding domain-containing protein [Pseudonocardiaceae bacterium]